MTIGTWEGGGCHLLDKENKNPASSAGLLNLPGPDRVLSSEGNHQRPRPAVRGLAVEDRILLPEL